MNPKKRISKAETLDFLLSYMVVERGHTLTLNPMKLFGLASMAQRAADEINRSDETIPHEIIERLADAYLADE